MFELEPDNVLASQLTGKRITQLDIVRMHPQSGRAITQMEAAFDYGIWRLAAVVEVLRRREGMDIRSEMVPITTRLGIRTRFAKYAIDFIQRELPL